MEFSFLDELQGLKSSYDTSEFSCFVSNKSHILKFFLHDDSSLTFEIPEKYPQVIPFISLASTKISNSQKILVETELRNYAQELIGSPMIMDLVSKVQGSLEVHMRKEMCSKPKTLKSEDDHMAIILIDHIRQKNRYLKALTSWSSDLNIVGVLVFCHKWIFLIIQGCRKNVKEFIIRHRTNCIDVDSSGKPCKEKMSKIIFEGNSLKSFTSFSVEELSTLKDLEEYLKDRNMGTAYQDIFKPVLFKS